MGLCLTKQKIIEPESNNVEINKPEIVIKFINIKSIIKKKINKKFKQNTKKLELKSINKIKLRNKMRPNKIPPFKYRV